MQNINEIKRSELLLITYRNYLNCLYYYKETKGAYGDSLTLINMYKKELMKLDPERALVNEYIELLDEKEVKKYRRHK